MAGGAREAGATASTVPMSDGGDGLLEVLGGANRESVVTGPAGTPVRAAWRLADGVAVVESACASGLVLAGGRDANDPMTATSAGTGELLTAAVEAGARRVLLGLGGSACTDGGLPAMDAVPAHVRDAIANGSVELVVCCDVTTRYTDAAVEFAPQKGADADQVRALSERLVMARRRVRDRFGFDVQSVAGSGAAGGLGGALAALGGRLRPGFDVVAAQQDLRAHVVASDLVVTGEGRVDRTSFAGKVVGGVTALARECGVEVEVVAGDIAGDIVDDRAGDVIAGVTMHSLVRRHGVRRAHDDVLACVTELVRELVVARIT
ncbi:glycerate kinase [Jatrophihabitans fulvus]